MFAQRSPREEEAGLFAKPSPGSAIAIVAQCWRPSLLTNLWEAKSEKVPKSRTAPR